MLWVVRNSPFRQPIVNQSNQTKVTHHYSLQKLFLWNKICPILSSISLYPISINIPPAGLRSHPHCYLLYRGRTILSSSCQSSVRCNYSKPPFSSVYLIPTKQRLSTEGNCERSYREFPIDLCIFILGCIGFIFISLPIFYQLTD